MSTIKATKIVNGIGDISQLLALMKEFGTNNVSCYNTWELVDYTDHHHIDTEVWDEVFDIANKDTLNDLLQRILGYGAAASIFARAYNITEEEFASKLIDLAIANETFLTRVPDFTPINKLNELAEKKLVALYYVERVKSIDVDFVSKYYEQIDLRSLHSLTTNNDVKNMVYTLMNREIV